MSSAACLPLFDRTLCDDADALPRRRIEIAVIDTGLAGWQGLRDGVKPGTEIILIDGGSDGMAELVRALAGRTGIDAVHVFSHGFPGGFILGSATLDATTLQRYEPKLRAVAASLSRDGEILLYGCNIASGSGPAFLSALAAITGSNLAAAYNLTGAALLGGDWDLGYRSGRVESGVALTDAAMQGYRHTLSISTVSVIPLEPAFRRGTGSSGFSLFSGADANINTLVGVDFTGAVFQVYNLSGGNEFLTIGGTDMALTDGTTGSFSSGNYAVSVTGGVATVTLSGMALNNAAMNTLLDGASYKNTSGAGSSPGVDEDRSIVLRTVTDNGSVLPNSIVVDKAATVTINDGTAADFRATQAPGVDTATFSGAPLTVHFAFTLPSTILIGSTVALTPVVPAGWTTTDVVSDQLFTGLVAGLTYDYAFSITGTGTDTSGSFPISFVSTATGLDLTNAIQASSVMVTVISAPVFVSMAAFIGGQTIVLTYDRDLDPSNPPLLTSFSGSAPGKVSINGSDVSLSSVSVSGATVTLTIGTALSAGDIIDLSYADPTIADDSSAIQSTGGVDAATTTFTSYIVTTVPFNPPTLTATGDTASFVQGGLAGVDLFSSAAADTNDVGQTITGFTMTVTNVSDTSESIGFPGPNPAIALTNGGAGPVGDPGSSGTGAVTGVGSTKTLTVSGLTLTVSNFVRLIDGMTYFNSAGSVTPGARVVTLTSVTDSGSNHNVDTLSGIVATVNVSATPPGPTVTETLVNDSGSSSSDNITKNPALSGTSEANRTVTITEGIATLGTTVADGSGVWTFTPTGLADGSHTIVASETNVAAVTGSDTLTFTLDTTPPTVTAALTSDTGSSSTDRITSDPALTGTSEANRIVTLKEGITTLGTTTANGAGIWTFTPTLADGSHTIVATETDVAGNTGSGTLAITLDTTAPAAPTGLALQAASDTGVLGDGITNLGRPTLEGDAAPDSTITITGTVGGVPLGFGTAVVGNNGHWTFTPPSAVPNGVYTATATDTDAAANVSASSSAFVVTIDTTAPIAPVISSAALSELTHPVVAGTAEAGSTVRMSVGGATYSAIATGGAWSIDLATATPVTGVLALNNNGVNSVSVTATDTAGNLSTAGTQSLTIDTTAPAAPVVSSPSVTNSTTPVIGGNAEAGSTVRVTVGGATYSTVATGGVWSIDLATATPAAGVLALDTNGTNLVSATAMDPAGNVSSAASQTLTIDTTAPAAPTGLGLQAASDSGVLGDGITNHGRPTLTGDGEPLSTITVTGTFGGVTFGVGFAEVDINGHWSITPLADIPDGVYTATAIATDPAGNESVASSAIVGTIDTVPPAAPVISSAALSELTHPVVAGTAEAGSTVRMTVGGATYSAIATGGAWSIDLATATPVTGVLALNNNGVNSVSVTATDTAGNLSTAGTQSLTIDTTAPAAPVVSSPSVTNSTTPVIGGNAEAGSTVRVTVGGATYSTVATGGVWSIDLATATPAAGVLALDTNGTNLVSATAMDPAGNVSGAASQTLTIDTTAPAAPTGLGLQAASDSGAKGDRITSATRPTLTGTGENGATVTLYDNGVAVGTATVVGGVWSVSPEVALAAGSHPLTFTQTDAAGNVSPTSEILPLTIDTTPPASPSALTLAPASDSGTPGDNITNVTRPNLTGTGPVGSTITLYDGETVIGNGIVNDSGAWSITPLIALSPGVNRFTATATDVAGNVSGSSTVLGITIDGTKVTSTTFVLPATTSTINMGLRPPTNPTFSLAQLTISVSALPTNGTVTLADGSPATVGQQLTGEQLAGLLFTPAAGQSETTSAFVYSVTDPLDDVSTGTIELKVGSETPQIATGGQIPNTPTPVITGTAVPGTPVELLDNGLVTGSTTADGTDGHFSVQTGTLSIGLHRLTATATLSGGVATSAPLVVFVVQDPVGGTSTTDFSSADIGGALTQGAKLAFIGGTEAVQLTDATLSVGPNTGEATIQRLYQGLLGRDNDVHGISSWDALLLSGASKSVVTAGMLESAEYISAHGTQADGQFVATLYQNLLGRSSDPTEVASWIGQLANGASRADVALGIADADEAKVHLAPGTARVYVPHPAGTLTHELYETGLGREVELGVLGDYNRLYDLVPPSTIAATIAASPEFVAQHGNQGDTAYVNSLYLSGAGRSADATGSAFWTGRLGSGAATRADVMQAIATSTEAASHLTYNLGG